VDLGADDRRRRVRDWLGTLGQGRPAAEGVAGPVAFDAGHAVVGRGVRIATVGEPERPLLAAEARVAEGSR
jgi:hypothetical protein